MASLLRKSVTVFFVAVLLACVLSVGAVGGSVAHASTGQCGSFGMGWGLDPGVDIGRVNDDIAQKAWTKLADDIAGHHAYLWVNYITSGASYSVYNATLNQLFSSQDIQIWGNYGGTTRFGVHSWWVLSNLPHFFTDQWVLNDSSGC